MVNFRDPAVVAQNVLAGERFWHALAGLYFWEFVTTMDYEWGVIRGRRPYRWTIVIYTVTRLATLLTVILSVYGMDSTARYNCQLRIFFQFFFGYLSFVAASLLIVLRNIAIWNRKKLVIAIAAGVWVVNLGFQIQGLARTRDVGVPELATCTTSNIHSTKLNLITMLINDIVLLLIMLIGLLRLGFYESSVYGVGKLMWKQGLIWIFLATIAEVVPVVFISLDLNDPLNYMFNFPSMITISIAATRIYRSLVDFLMESCEPSGGDRTNTSRTIRFATPNSSRVPVQPNTVETVEVAVHKSYEQYRTSQTSQDASIISGEGPLRDKPASLRPDYDSDVERGAGSGI